ncbi:hypothetical protein VJ786_02650 [Sphingobacterium sp. PU5-4]|uniref:Uncharacterized protein n=1 Tax=Sphingobacterium tenebrionis TaxID=3111775 RepID=A0ABU8I2X0_9SPHI
MQETLPLSFLVEPVLPYGTSFKKMFSSGIKKEKNKDMEKDSRLHTDKRMDNVQHDATGLILVSEGAVY